METKIVKVTPVIALDWLKKNLDNRPLRRTVVEGIKLAYARGEYRLTHQGIAFDTSGALIDGQHRLTAISEMPPNFAVEMLVTKGLARNAFEAIDIGVKRTAGDVLRVSQGLAAVSRFMATIVETQKSGITPQLLIPYVTACEAPFLRLVDYCPTVTKTWSSAAIRTAAILRMLGGGDADYVMLSYHALNHADYDSMSKIIQTLHRQQARGMVRQGGIDIFLRAHKAFDYRSQSMDRIQVNDHTARVAALRDFITAKVLGQKKATSKPVAKVNGRNSTRAVA